MTDEKLIQLLRLGEWGGAGDEEMVLAADRIEQLVKDVNEIHEGTMETIKSLGAALKGQHEAEAKLARAVDIIKQVIATAHADDYVAWDSALDDGIAFIAELEKTE